MSQAKKLQKVLAEPRQQTRILITPFPPEKVLSRYTDVSRSLRNEHDVAGILPYAELIASYYGLKNDFLENKLIANKPSFEKGLLFSGTVGAGKTFMMDTFSRMFVGTQNWYRFTTARQIARDFNINGHAVLDQYGKQSYHKDGRGHLDKSRPLTVCIDDLGTEDDGSHYGQKFNVIAEIVQDRHEEWLKTGMTTHFTTNLNGDQIEEQYGERVRSRIRQMCNWIPFKGKDLRE